MVPALKLPDASRETTVFAVLSLVAVTASVSSFVPLVMSTKLPCSECLKVEGDACFVSKDFTYAGANVGTSCLSRRGKLYKSDGVGADDGQWRVAEPA